MAMPRSDKVPSLKKVPAAWREADREARFWAQHYDEYLERYANQFVAVHKGDIVAASEDLGELINVLQAKGIAPRDTWIKFITADPRYTIL